MTGLPPIYELKRRYLRCGTSPKWVDLGNTLDGIVSAPVFIVGREPFDVAYGDHGIVRLINDETENNGLFMPFPQYMLQIQDYINEEDDAHFAFYIKDIGEFIVICQWIRGIVGSVAAPEWSDLLATMIYKKDESSWRTGMNPECKPKAFADRVEASFGAAQIAAFFLKYGAQTVEAPVSRTHKRIASARGITGTVYKLLDVGGVSVAVKRQHGGGTHASPRHHLRRSHIRKLPSGRTVTVRSCEVGSKDTGQVVKDYNFSPGALAEAARVVGGK